MVNAGDRMSPVKSLLILATYLSAFVGLAHSQMGISFDKCACKDEFENVKEFKEMGETFTSAELNDKKNGLKTIYTFYNGKLVRVKFSRSDDREWSEDLAQRLWGKWFNEDAICSRRESFDKDQKEDWLIIFNGKDRNQMVLGRGKYKSSLLLESSAMTTLKSNYVKTQIGKSNKTLAGDDQYQPLIPLPWQKRVTKEEYMKRRAADELEDDEQSTYSRRGGYGGVINQNGSMSDSTGAYSGFVAPGGAMYDKNGRYAGQVSPGGAMSDSTGRYSGSVNRGTIINNP
jgi:hypothetical protein